MNSFTLWLMIWLLACGLLRGAENIPSPSNLLASAQKAGRAKNWPEASALYSAYLKLDPVSPTADKVRTEMRNIRWRMVYLSTLEGAELPVQQAEEEHVEELLDQTRYDEAVELSMGMIRKRPTHWRSYLLAAASFAGRGEYDSAREILSLGGPVMDAIQLKNAEAMYAELLKEERLQSELKQASELLKANKPGEAANRYVALAKEWPAREDLLRLAIQSSVLAERYTMALSLVKESPHIKPQVKDELNRELTKLRNEYLSLQSPGPSRSSNPATQRATGGSRSPSMSKDFLNRIGKP